MRKRFIARGRKYNGSKIVLIVFLILSVLIFSFLWRCYINTSDEAIKRILIVANNEYANNLFSYFNIDRIDPLEKNTVVVKSPNELIYIYNTHQTEEYAAGALKDYNLTPNVLIASNMFSKFLKGLGIESIVEERNLKEELLKHNFTYDDAYTLTFNYLEEIHDAYPSVKYYIDIHRDSTSGSIIINDKKYAKMMFVIGKNHVNYELNEELALQLQDYLNNNYNGVMRDIFYGKNSRYNQHFDKNVLLVEIGGVDNTIDEVYNSTQILAEAISYIIGE